MAGIDRSSIAVGYQQFDHQIGDATKGCSKQRLQRMCHPIQARHCAVEPSEDDSLVVSIWAIRTGPSTRKRQKGRPSTKRELTTMPSSEAPSVASVRATGVARAG